MKIPLPLYKDFNSIKVQLKLNEQFPFLVDQANFNSIKVQLKLLIHSFRIELLIFQLHKGTIKTLDKIAKLLDVDVNFNYIKVQLKHFDTFVPYRTIDISIP